MSFPLKIHIYIRIDISKVKNFEIDGKMCITLNMYY